MTKEKIPRQQFIEEFQTIGPAEMSRIHGVDLRNVFARRRRIEKMLDIRLHPPGGARPFPHKTNANHPAVIPFDIENGVILIGSDAHYWPEYVSTAHRAFVHACETMNPKAVIMNGDVFDGASISRHPSIGWESRPTVRQEIDVCKERLAEIQSAAPDARHMWTLGNHDLRFETKLAAVAPEMADVDGVHLKDHFPDWEPGWAVHINPDEKHRPSVVVKHRYKGGIHATRNNTLNAGCSIVTGHLHSLKITPFDDYNGTRWGIDTGTLADPAGPQFSDYLETNPTDWRSGFIVLTFQDRELLQPEMLRVIDTDKVDFRGKVWTV